MTSNNKNTRSQLQETRLALVYGLVGILEDTGKIRLQKLLYFLQEACGVPTGFSFRMHHYGPYSEDLDTDLTRLKMGGYLNIVSDPQGYGFHVNVADGPDEKWQDIFDSKKTEIERTLALFGDKTPSQLELMATIHFVDRLHDHPKTKELVTVVNGLKPKFTSQYIETCCKELTENGLLSN
ncbi:MAG: hypothetical protein IH963_14980 [Chloroflexi bacterium]|nr:hypothetical protein [Chloroflexota bacterium]